MTVNVSDDWIRRTQAVPQSRPATQIIYAVMLISVAISLCHQIYAQDSREATVTGTEAERVAFYDEFVEKTMRRTAWSELKWKSLGTDFKSELERLNLRADFAQASDRSAFDRALLRLHNTRRDSHLRLASGQRLLFTGIKYAPVRLLPDLTNLGTPQAPVRFLPLFVANYNQQGAAQGIKRGDQVIAINGVPIETVQREMELLVSSSTPQHYYCRTLTGWSTYAGLMSAKIAWLGDSFYSNGDDAVYRLKDVDSGRTKRVELKYAAGPVEWLLPPVISGSRSQNRKRYEAFYESMGFEQVSSLDNKDGALWLKPDAQLAILEWYDFESVRASVDDIIAAAQEHKALDFDLIIDATHSSGGSHAQRLIQVLTDRPFKTTFGNVRTSDVEFAKANLPGHSPSVMWWISKALLQNADYTTKEPFKLRYSEMIQPARVRFTGRKVLLLFPFGGSQLDQFAAMIIDNHKSNGIHSIGTTMGGFSNTWEWAEDVKLPGKLGTARIEWSAGHTIRPNGEVLEGNPARAKQWFPLTPANAGTYFRDLIDEAMQYLLAHRK